eukprot:1144389-Pelagomonas_calceolata.AAC.1
MDKASMTSMNVPASRPHTSLWLTKTYIFPASMYGSQIWGTSYMKAGAEMDNLLQTGHLCFSKRVCLELSVPLATGPCC